MKTLILAGLLLCGASFAAQAQSCDELWYQRNAIYKSGGYCFKTSRAIGTFGNAGCQFDNERDVPLSANDRGRIAEIIQNERAYGCR